MASYRTHLQLRNIFNRLVQAECRKGERSTWSTTPTNVTCARLWRWRASSDVLLKLHHDFTWLRRHNLWCKVQVLRVTRWEEGSTVGAGHGHDVLIVQPLYKNSRNKRGIRISDDNWQRLVAISHVNDCTMPQTQPVPRFSVLPSDWTSSLRPLQINFLFPVPRPHPFCGRSPLVLCNARLFTLAHAHEWLIID